MKIKTALLTVPGLFYMLICLAGCGYHNPYTGLINSGKRPTTLFIERWENRTGELNLEGLIARRLTDWLQGSRILKLTGSQDQAELLLTGIITSVDYPASTYSATDQATTLKARVTATCRLLNRKTGELLWEIPRMVRSADYPVGSDAVMSQSNKKKALMTIADELSELIYLKVNNTLVKLGG